MKCKHTMDDTAEQYSYNRACLGEVCLGDQPLPAWVWSSGCLDSAASKTTAPPALAPAGPSLGRTQGTRDEAREAFHSRAAESINVADARSG